MKLDPDKHKMIVSYFLCLIPLIGGILMAVLNESDNNTVNQFYLINVFFGAFISIGFINAVSHMFSFSLFVNHNLVYLMNEKLNHRIIWDDIKEVHLGEYTWLKVRWLCFFHQDDDPKKHLVFRLSVLSDGNIDKLLAQIKMVAKDRSIKINY